MYEQTDSDKRRATNNRNGRESILKEEYCSNTSVFIL